MSTQSTPQYPYQPPQAPLQFQAPVFQPLPPKPKGTGPKLVAGGIAAIMLLGIGGAMGRGTTPAAVPLPAVTTTATATTTTVTTKVPAVCLSALEDADKIVLILGESLDITVDIIAAVSSYNAKAINAVTTRIEAMTVKISSNTYATTSAACRAQGRG